MGFNKKLVLVGLAAGVSAYMLYKASKKKDEKHSQQAAPVPAQTQHSSSNAGLYAGAGAGLAAAGAAAAYAHHQQSQSHSVAPPTSPANVTWDHLRDWRFIARILCTCVQEQYLYPFWTYDAVARLAVDIASTGKLVAAADAWKLPPSLAQDLVKLALFDVMFLLDDSASMNAEGRLRPQALQGIVRRASEAAARFDPDGIECAWMNEAVQRRVHTAAEAEALAEQCTFRGRATPMGTALESKLLQPNLISKAQSGTLSKPVLVLIITDGRPTGESSDKILRVLQSTKRTLSSTRYGEDAVSFQIAAVGNDREAQEWLESVDSHKEVGDLIDVCSDIRAEARQVRAQTGIELTEELYCLKILLGGIDHSYDASDEDNTSFSFSQRKKQKKRQEKMADKQARFAREAATFRSAMEHGLAPGAPAPNAAPAASTAAPGAPQVPAQPQAGGGYGAPIPAAAPAGGYSAPPQPQAGAYGAPPQPQAGAGYGAPAYPLAGGGYGAPPQPQAGGYGAPPQPHGYGAQPSGYGITSNSSSYGAPTQSGSYAGGGGGGGGYPSSMPPYMQGGPGGSPYPPSGAPPPYTFDPSSTNRSDPGQGQGQGQGGAAFQPGTGGFAMPTPQHQQWPSS